MSTVFSSSTLLPLLCFFSRIFLSVSSSDKPIIDPANPVADITLSPILASSGDVDYSCGRALVSPSTRPYQITLVPSESIPKGFHSSIHVCFHLNASLPLCHCEKKDWIFLQEGSWSSSLITSPNVQRFLDVKFTGGVPTSVTVTRVEEASQQWRSILLAIGFAMLFPLSIWVLFYYFSSMALGFFAVSVVLAVSLVLLFMGRKKLLKIGKKNGFFVVVSVLGGGKYMGVKLSMLLSFVNFKFELSEEMQHPASVLLLVGIFIGAVFYGYRKSTVSRDGGFNVGVAQVFKWISRVAVVASVFLDLPIFVRFALVLILCCYFALCTLINSIIKLLSRGVDGFLHTLGRFGNLRNGQRNSWDRQATSEHLHGRHWNDQQNTFASWIDGGRGSTGSQQDFYSTFHKVTNREKFSKKEHEKLTKQLIRQKVTELVHSPEFIDFLTDNAVRFKIVPDDGSDGNHGEDVVEKKSYFPRCLWSIWQFVFR